MQRSQTLLLAVSLMACQEQVDPSDSVYLGSLVAFEEVDVPLPGADPDGEWEFVDGALPPGVVVVGSGSISGQPSAQGNYEFEVGSNSGGQLSYTVDVEYPDNVITCGQSVSVDLPGGQDMFGYPFTGDFSDPSLTAWVLIPPDMFGNLQIDLELETEQNASFFGLNPDQPGIPGPGEQLNIGWVSTGRTFTMRSGGQTDPAWWADTSGPAAVAIGSAEPGTGVLTMTCDSGPLGRNWNPTPGVVGEAVYWQFQAVGDGLTYAASSGLPPGTVLNETEGIVTGVPTTAGAWTVQIEVTDANGNQRTFPVDVEVAAAPLVATCGETVEFTVTAGGNPGWDLSGLPLDYFVLVDIDVPSGLSSLTVRGADDNPDPWFAFVDVVMDDRQSLGEQWPGLALVEGQQIRGIAGALTPGSHTLIVECEQGLRIEDAGSIVVDPEQPFALEAVGGVPPYTWSLDSSRTDMTVSSDGVVDILRYQWWLHLGQVVLTDSQGATAGTDAYLVESADACAAITPIGCGERIEWVGPNEEFPRVCLEPDTAGTLRTSAHPLAQMVIKGAARVPFNGREYRPRPVSPEEGWEVYIPERMVGTVINAELQMLINGWRGESGWFEYDCDN